MKKIVASFLTCGVFCVAAGVADAGPMGTALKYGAPLGAGLIVGAAADAAVSNRPKKIETTSQTSAVQKVNDQWSVQQGPDVCIAWYKQGWGDEPRPFQVYKTGANAGAVLFDAHVTGFDGQIAVSPKGQMAYFDKTGTQVTGSLEQKIKSYSKELEFYLDRVGPALGICGVQRPLSFGTPDGATVAPQ